MRPRNDEAPSPCASTLVEDTFRTLPTQVSMDRADLHAEDYFSDAAAHLTKSAYAAGTAK